MFFVSIYYSYLCKSDNEEVTTIILILETKKQSIYETFIFIHYADGHSLFRIRL
jgi:hypothetical protein